MYQKRPGKVSYCITCKARLDHLKVTVPANLQAEANNPNVEFVILDYDCPQGTKNWVKANFRPEIEQGRIRIAHHAPAPVFSAEHAKNMAARLATGDIVVNLDGDNRLAPDTSFWIADTFAKDPNSVITNWTLTIRENLYERAFRARMKRPGRDAGGFIAVSRANFERLGGYDESLVGSWEDPDFGVGARRLGLTIVKWPQRYWVDVIPHEDDMRTKLLSAATQQKWAERRHWSSWRHRVQGIQVLMGRQSVSVNAGSVGCGVVRTNFSPEPVEIKPYPVG